MNRDEKKSRLEKLKERTGTDYSNIDVEHHRKIMKDYLDQHPGEYERIVGKCRNCGTVCTDEVCCEYRKDVLKNANIDKNYYC